MIWSGGEEVYTIYWEFIDLLNLYLADTQHTFPSQTGPTNHLPYSYFNVLKDTKERLINEYVKNGFITLRAFRTRPTDSTCVPVELIPNQ